MSNIINASVDANSNLIVEEAEGFSGEHNAETLEISLGNFASDDYDYYQLSFSNSRIAGKQVSNRIRTASDKPVYISGKKIYCPLTAELTCTGRLKIQLEAHRISEGKELIKKTSVAEIKFKPSILGIEDILSSDSPSAIRFMQIEERIDELAEREAALGSKLDANKAEFNSKLDSKEAQLSSRISDAEQKHESDMSSLGNELDKLRTIPFASEETCGGFITGIGSQLELERGYPVLKYNALNYTVMTLYIVAFLSDKTGGTNTFVCNNMEEVQDAAYNYYFELYNAFREEIIFPVIEGGEFCYLDEEYNEIPATIQPYSIAVLKNVNGKIVYRNYLYHEFRTLLAEGT